MGEQDRQPTAVVVQQPALPAYRIPFFEGLACEPALDLTLHVSPAMRTAPTVEPGKLRVEWGHARSLAGGALSFDRNQLRAANSGADVVVLSWNVRYPTLIPAILLAKLRRSKVLLWGQGYSSASRFPVGGVLRRTSQWLADGVVLYDEAAAAAVGSSGHPVFVCPNAIDATPIKRFRAHWPSRSATRRLLQEVHNLPEGPMVVTVGRLEDRRGIGLLLRAFADLFAGGFEAVLVVVGEGPCRAALETQAERLGLGDRVRFIGGIDEESLAPWMVASDVACAPGHVGLAVLHYAAYGLPTVMPVSAPVRHSEARLFVNGRSAATFEDGSATSLSVVLRHVLSDPDFREKIADGAAAVSAYRSMERMVAGMRQAILEIVGRE